MRQPATHYVLLATHDALSDMSIDQLLNFVPVFVLVLFRIAGLMLFAPLLGSAKIPKRVKVLLALVLAMGMTAGVARPAHLPESTWGMALGIVFISAQWAGEIIGQQMGFNLNEVFDPQMGAASSVVGDIYYFLTL